MDETEEDCIKTIKFGSNEMSVNICAMLDSCNCTGENCCSNGQDKRKKNIEF